jgi:hypothetical protein
MRTTKIGVWNLELGIEFANVFGRKCFDSSTYRNIINFCRFPAVRKKYETQHQILGTPNFKLQSLPAQNSIQKKGEVFYENGR